MENNKMEQLPNCPKCNSEYTKTGLLICPECAHEWTVDATNENGGDEKIVKRFKRKCFG